MNNSNEGVQDDDARPIRIKFSIITITYNAESVLQRTLDSVRSQSWPNIEHIIVDGASTDGTVSMAEEYARESGEETEHVVRIISEPDKGLYDAMNKGLRMATGDYIVYMNAGDFYPNESVITDMVLRTELQDYADEKLPAVIYGNTDIVDIEGNFLYPRRLTPPERLSWWSFRYGMLVCHQAFYARLDIAKVIEYNLDYKHSSDVDWCIRIMKHAKKRGLSLVNSHLVLVNYTNEGNTTRHHQESLNERYRIMTHHYGHILTFVMHCWFAIRALIKKER